MSRTTHTRVPTPLYEEAKRVKEDRDFASIGEALRQMCNEGGYNV